MKSSNFEFSATQESQEQELSGLIGRCHGLEKIAHVTLDDVMNKAAQEVAEMVEASLSGDVDETRKEAGDALINVFSSSHAVGALPEMPVAREGQDDAAGLLVKFGKWNSKIQFLRGKYSRSSATVAEVREAASALVQSILSFVGPDADPVVMVAKTVEKFESRVRDYLPKIELRDFVAEYADFPKSGIQFKDVSPLLADPVALDFAAHEIAIKCAGADVIVGLDARGFLFGMAAARILEKPFVMVRKKGKLPGATFEKAYGLEYGQDVIEIQKCANLAGKKVAIVDDLLATGGTAMAAAELVEKAGGVVESVVFAISLDDEGLKSTPNRKALEKYRIESVLSYS